MDNDVNSHPLPTIDFWFEFGSNYSYLSAMRIEEAAAQRGVTVNWRPFLLGPIFQSFGWNSSPFVLQQAKGVYVWKDMQRQCSKYGIPWRMPAVFPRPATIPMKVAAAFAGEPWIGRYCRTFMTKNFALDEDINSLEQVSKVLAEIGVDAQDVIDAAFADDRKNLLREATAEAQAKGVFGAPMFFVRGEMFWGNDRLDDALAFAGVPA
ncbi:2-hydroxychromene-2-carboxylate isomerase [Hydrogenophaga sp. RWCD_12]|uniref:2-hydroxychromene-2-carboxylate isomerase n=1 Tax=Hydrogenophaga sp. RWCD_12 TaxID=3391190 RepID=UPI0039855E22